MWSMKWQVISECLAVPFVYICQGAADSAHILRLSRAASFPRRATKVQSGEMLYEFTSPATGYIGLLVW